jgi:hypothetical protein
VLDLRLVGEQVEQRRRPLAIASPLGSVTGAAVAASCASTRLTSARASSRSCRASIGDDHREARRSDRVDRDRVGVNASAGRV